MRFLIAALAALLLIPASASADRADCYPRKSKTVKRTKQARIYTVSVGDGYRRTYGCLYRTGKRLPLDDPAGNDEIAFGPFKLAGRYAMYQAGWDSSRSYEYRPNDVVVANLRTGRTRSVVNWSPDADNAIDEAPDGEVVRTVLRANGNAAWTSRDSGSRAGVEVWTLIKGRATRVDTRGGIDPRSLRLKGDRITWTKAGVRRSAPLP